LNQPAVQSHIPFHVLVFKVVMNLTCCYQNPNDANMVYIFSENTGKFTLLINLSIQRTK